MNDRYANAGTPDQWLALIEQAAEILGTSPEYWNVGCVAAALNYQESRLAALEKLVASLSERCHKQSELLSRRAEAVSP